MNIPVKTEIDDMISMFQFKVVYQSPPGILDSMVVNNKTSVRVLYFITGPLRLMFVKEFHLVRI